MWVEDSRGLWTCKRQNGHDGQHASVAEDPESGKTRSQCGVWIEGAERRMCSRPVGHEGAHSAAPGADAALLDACNELSWAVAERARAAKIYDAAAVALANARAELVECDARYADARALVAALLGPAPTLTGDAASRILGDG